MSTCWKARLALIFACRVACFVGFSVQVAHISSQYFGYPTATRIVSHHQSDEEFDSPLLVFCSDAWSHIDPSHLTADWVSET